MRPKLLFLAHLLPWPLNGGGQIKSYHTLRALAVDCDITLLSYVRPGDDPGSFEALRPLCAGGILTIPLPRGRAYDLRAVLAALPGRRSWIIERDRTGAMARALEEVLTAFRYAALHVDHLQMAAFVPEPERFPGLKIVLDAHNVEHRLIARVAETTPGPLAPLIRGEAARLKAFERQAVRRADLTLAVSDDDRAALAALGGKSVVTVPIGVDLDHFAPLHRTPRVLLSIGTLSWPPNIEGLRWFCREVRPRLGDLPLRLVGARPGAAVRALGELPAVEVVADPPDVRPYAADCAVFVVPLRAGSGMRVKVLTALAMGLPVVATSLAVEGIALCDGQHFLCADTPDAFADACARLLADPELGNRLGAAGRALMEERYGWEAIGCRLRSVYAAAGVGA